MIEFALAEAIRRRVAAAAGAGLHGRAQLVEAVAAAGALARRAHAELAEADVGISCRSGCAYCCHMRVVATVPEVIALHDHIAARFDEAELVALVDRIASVAGGKSAGLSDEEWGRARIPCPLLVDGACSAYAARPLDCRGYNSRDVSACASAFEDYESWDVPMSEPLMAMNKSAQAGLMQGLAGLGRRPCLVELSAALSIAFEDSTAIDRWLDGEESFASAELATTDPEQLAFLPWVPSDLLRAALEEEEREP